MNSVAGLPALSPSAPRARIGPIAWLARGLLRLHGWRVVGVFPDTPRLVLVGFPHTSNWDGYFGVLFVLATRLKLSLMIKHTALKGIGGSVLRRFGFVAADRTRPVGVVPQMLAQFAAHERFWLGMTPEGTRRHAAEIKHGFHRIARGAGAQLMPVCIDYRNRCIRLLPAFAPGPDAAADVERLLAQLAGQAWPRHPDRLSAPLRKALTGTDGQLIAPPPA